MGKYKGLVFGLILGILTIQGCNSHLYSNGEGKDQQYANNLSTTDNPAADVTASITPTINFTTSSPTITTTIEYSELSAFMINEDNVDLVTSFPKIAGSTSAVPLWNSVICKLLNIICYWLVSRGKHQIPPKAVHP